MRVLKNLINGEFVDASTSASMTVINPADESVVASVPLSVGVDVEVAVTHAKRAFAGWSGLTIKQRAGIMFKFHQLVETHSEELAQLIVLENGKNMTEALADVAKGKSHYCIY
jgi:malonate-semialdehyde dehydrogenase (acetylating) / methylmalonate-semialdehyde dehydrogenase